MNRILKRILIITFVIVFLLGSIIALSTVELSPKIKLQAADGYDIKNVILFIGDGMGSNHLETAKIYSQTDSLSMEKIGFSGKAKTYSKGFITTDSAAAATAMATGHKVFDGQVGRNTFKKLKNICEYAKESNLKTGIVTTEHLYGATPASFSAHAGGRSMTSTIVKNQITSGIDLFIGKESTDSNRYKSKMDSILENGYEFCESYDELLTLQNADKLFVTLENISPLEITLKMMITFALDYLADNSDGFFLMAEGAHIDKKSHRNDIISMINELLGFDAAIEYASTWAEARKDTMIIVTADHETGGLKIKGSTKESISDKWFSRKGHTGAKVPVFIQGASLNKQTINNTEVFSLCRQALAI